MLKCTLNSNNLSLKKDYKTSPVKHFLAAIFIAFCSPTFANDCETLLETLNVRKSQYVNAFAEYKQTTLSKLEEWSHLNGQLHATLVNYEGELSRIPMGQFDDLVANNDVMQTATQDWSDKSIALDDISYSIEDLVQTCVSDSAMWLERYQTMASDERLLENQLISYLQGTLDKFVDPLAMWQSWQGVQMIIPQDAFLLLKNTSQNHRLLSLEYLPDLFTQHESDFVMLIEELTTLIQKVEDKKNNDEQLDQEQQDLPNDQQQKLNIEKD